MDKLRSISNDLLSLLSTMTIRDAVDIAMVAFVFFLVFSFLRASGSQVALRGLIIVLFTAVVLYLVTIVAELSAMNRLFERVWLIIVLVFIVVFQNEIRKSLTEFGRLPIFRALYKQEGAALEEIVKAAARLSEKKVGALICIERRTSLRPYIETGTVLDAVVSVELLRTVFAMYTPLHDGAVMIRNNRLVAAACLLPLTNQNLPRDLGTRHRAAVGLSEETDAVVVVVSEETGTISLTHDGMISRPESADSLRAKLRELFEIPDEVDRAEGA